MSCPHYDLGKLNYLCATNRPTVVKIGHFRQARRDLDAVRPKQQAILH